MSDQGELFPGATASGNVCVSVAADQVAGASIVLDQFLSSTHLVLAAQARQGTAAPSPAGTPPALATPDANAVRGTRANPFGLGEEIALGDWKLKVDSVDSDAWPEIQAVNGFNDPPADGRQFVMFHATAANVGAEAGNPSLSPAWTVVGSRGNTFGASLSDYCGVIPDALSDQGDGGHVAAGESAAGNICVSVPIDQLDGATIQVKPAFGDPRFRRRGSRPADQLRQPLGWTTASTLLLGSRNHAAHEWPMSAMPSTVTGSGAVYSSMRTPRERRSTTAALMSGTRQAICVCVSDVPVVLSVTTSCVPPPERNTIRSPGSSRATSRPRTSR